MKRLLGTAAVVAALLAIGSSSPASAGPLPVQGEPVLCSLDIGYGTSPFGASAYGSGTCTGLLQLQRYSATVSSFFGRNGGGCPPATMPLFLEMSNPDGSSRHLALSWSPNTLGLLDVANIISVPLQLGPLVGPGLLGLGFGGGPANCTLPEGTSGTMHSNATFLFTTP